MRWVIAAVLALLVCGALLPPASAQEENPLNYETFQKHKQASWAGADFTVSDLNGRSITLSSLAGQAVLINVWASWCGPCKREIPDLIQIQKDYAAKGFTIIGIVPTSNDQESDVRKVVAETGINYPVVMVPDKVANLWGEVEGFPTTYILGRDGKVVESFLGTQDYGTFAAAVEKALATQGPAASVDWPPKAPDFSLAGIDGATVSLSDHSGEVVIVDIWDWWCPPCKAEIPFFVELQNQFKDKGFTIIGLALGRAKTDPQSGKVLSEGATEVSNIMKELGVNYPVALLTDEVGKAYGSPSAIPTTFLIGRDGRVVDIVQGYAESEKAGWLERVSGALNAPIPPKQAVLVKPFELKDPWAEAVSLNLLLVENQGVIVVAVEGCSKSDTPLAYLRMLRDNYSVIRDAGLQVVVVCADGQDAAYNIAYSMAAPFPVGVDADRKASENIQAAAGRKGSPVAIVLLDSSKTIKGKFFGTTLEELPDVATLVKPFQP